MRQSLQMHMIYYGAEDGYETRVGNAETGYPVVNARELPLPELF